MTLRTVTRDNKNLQQLILETFYDPVDQASPIRSAFLVDVVFRAGSEPPAICFVFVICVNVAAIPIHVFSLYTSPVSVAAG